MREHAYQFLPTRIRTMFTKDAGSGFLVPIAIIGLGCIAVFLFFVYAIAPHEIL